MITDYDNKSNMKTIFYQGNRIWILQTNNSKAGDARNLNRTDIIRKILILNNNGGGNDVETRHALSLL